MIRKTGIATALALAALFTLPGCAVHRGQSTVGAYVDDTTITTRVKTKLLADKQVDFAAVSVETLNADVLLSGFAKSNAERSRAEELARAVPGVKSVRNELVVQAK